MLLLVVLISKLLYARCTVRRIKKKAIWQDHQNSIMKATTSTTRY